MAALEPRRTSVTVTCNGELRVSLTAEGHGFSVDADFTIDADTSAKLARIVLAAQPVRLGEAE